MGEESPRSTVTTPTGAVFLSYASQDAEPARKICDALRAAGIEVWFDQSELRGGDAWDQKIRQQIHDCVLFMPLISSNTASRHEGYFRLEWDLADRRTHMIARNRAFIVPVCLDATPDAGADVPESFQRVQWTRISAGETPSSFVERVRRLLSPGPPIGATTPANAISGAGPAIPKPPRVSWWLKTALLAALAVVVLAVAYFAAKEFWVPKQEALEAAAGASTAVPAANGPVASVAVMPFANLTGDPSKDYFSDGMAEELIDALANVPGLKVPSRTSSFAYKAHNLDIRRVAQDLGVATILEGSVRSAGDRVRVTAQLVNAQSGYHLWSQTYDREFADIFKLQDDLARAIVAQLLGKIGVGSADAGIKPPGTQNAEAYRLFLQAGSFAAIPSEPSARRALSMVDQVLVLDPGYVDAWVTRAGIRSVLVGMSVFPAHELEQAERDAQHADTLRQNAGTSALAFIHTLLGQWAEADREYQTALATDGRTDPIAHFNYSLHLGAVGRKRRALELAQQAYELAPADQASIAFAALANLNLGHDAEALKFADLLTEFRPDNDISKLMRSTVAYRAGRFQEASDSAVGIALLTGRGFGGAGLEAEKLVILAAADPAKVGRARGARWRDARASGCRPARIARTVLCARRVRSGLRSCQQGAR
jgi:TolB-like protein